MAVTIRHPYRGDLSVELVAPGGTTHRLASPSITDSRADLVTTYQLRVAAARVGGCGRDVYLEDTGVLESWGIAA